MEEGDLVMAVDIIDEVITKDEAIEDQTEAKEYICKTCLKVLRNKNSLDYHISRAHRTFSVAFVVSPLRMGSSLVSTR